MPATPRNRLPWTLIALISPLPALSRVHNSSICSPCLTRLRDLRPPITYKMKDTSNLITGESKSHSQWICQDFSTVFLLIHGTNEKRRRGLPGGVAGTFGEIVHIWIEKVMSTSTWNREREECAQALEGPRGRAALSRFARTGAVLLSRCLMDSLERR